MENNNEEKLIEDFIKKIKPGNNWDPIKKAIVVKGPKPEDADEWEQIFQEEHPNE